MKLVKMVIVFLLMSNSIYSVNYETEGNLKSDTKILPEDIKQIKNTHNPVDLFKLCHRYIKNKSFEDAALIYYTAMAYGIFDAERVADKTAHQAISVLRINFSFEFSEEEMEAFTAAVKTVRENPENVLAFLKELGYPRYYPSYMIEHGMNAFMQNNKKKIIAINNEKVWRSILEDLSEPADKEKIKY